MTDKEKLPGQANVCKTCLMKKLFEDDLLPMTEEHHILSKVLRKLVSYINKSEDFNQN
jgi:hypothetical protein